MQEIMRQMEKRAIELLENGTVDHVLGWSAGEFVYDVTPAVFESADEVRATISTGLSVNHLITILIALFGGWIWQALGIETLFVLSAILGLCNSAYAATIKTSKDKAR